MEVLTSIRRAGANQVITYHALDAARWLREEYGWAAVPVRPESALVTTD
jgi:hypothetical protein